jgi:DeoR/GlpR family transcriptional regulator of sugar metabolism
MYQEQRLQKILDVVEEKGRLSSKEAISLMKVSRDTIRRDFGILAEKNLVIRKHGGILALQKSQILLSFEERLKNLVHEKDAIAQNALQLIENNHLYFFDVSTSILRLSQLIDKEVTIYSHSLDNALVLGQDESIDFHLLGGQFHHKNRFYYSIREAELLQNIHFDIAFIGAGGLKSGVVTFEDEADAYIKSLVLKNTKTKVLLAEQDKFNKQSNFVLTNVNNFDYLITDKEPNATVKQLLSPELTLIY